MIPLWKEMMKKRNFRRLLVVELLLVLLCVLGLFGKDDEYRYGPEDMTVRFGTYEEAGGSVRVDSSQGQIGNVVDFEGITLPAGVYRVSLHYQCDTDMVHVCTVSDATLGHRSLMTNGDLLYTGLDQTGFAMWLLRGTSSLTVHVAYNGQGSLEVSGLTIYETNALNRILLFLTVLLCCLFNALLMVREYDRKYGISREQKNVAFGLVLIMIAASLPLFTDYLISAADSTFHLWRIEGLKEGILSGQFPVRISPKWQYGYGYAAPVFYGETFLLFPAILRMIGFTIVDSYRYYLMAINAATVLMAYYCFGRIWRSRYLGLFCSMLYTVSVYHVHKMYCRGTLGEALALMLLPLLVYGFYKVFTEDIHAGEYRFYWIPLAIGYAGILQSHLLTGEMVGAFTILLCLVLWKKVFRRPTFLVLAKTVICALLVSAWFVVPFADYMLTGDFKIQHASGRLIQERGIYPAHLFLTFFEGGENVFFAKTGMYRTDDTGIGMALVAVLVLWIFLAFFGYTACMQEKDRKAGTILAAFSGLAMIMSLWAFPWDRIQFLNEVTKTLVSSLEFPDRLLSIANLCLAALAGLLGKYVLAQKRKAFKWAYFGGVTALVLFSSVYLMNDLLYHTEFTRIYNEEGMGFGYVSSGEYLPYGTDTTKLTFRDPFGEGIEVEGWERKGLTLQIGCVNETEGDRALEVPLLYYKGYRAYDIDTGEELEAYLGENFAVTVTIPAGFDGEVLVRFVPPWYWRLGEIISLISAVGLVFAGVRWKKERKHERA